MIPGSNMWDERKVTQVFTLEVGRRILDCPIARTNEDKIIWGHHSTGTYTTRTGQHWLLEKENLRSRESSLWKVIAKLPVLPKIRIFGWRLGRGALPVGHKIRATGMGEGICRLCGNYVETVLHAVRECTSVQEILSESGMVNLLPQGPFRDCMERLDASQTLLASEQFSFLIVLLWNIWNRRNRWIHTNQLIPARLVSEYAQLVHGDFQKSNENVVNRVTCARGKKWMKPEQGQVKINVDGAWLAANRTVAIGVIARDHHGLMIDGCAKMVEGAHTAETVEALLENRRNFPNIG
ncbi:hypothetical protein V6N13_109868 [Hibiscus sabdariffa]